MNYKFKVGDKVRFHRDWEHKKGLMKGTIVDMGESRRGYGMVYDIIADGHDSDEISYSVHDSRLWHRDDTDFIELIENGLTKLLKVANDEI